ncbi:unnamed protein product [Candida verbasci]|uniref:Chromatin modification-related protein EAF6 n=1 Tax=Candida verbasci TaxID=1227364 RepID=A0A9W4XG39_9ASCO|nr:unnamed protein product [Candida verbasci]
MSEETKVEKEKYNELTRKIRDQIIKKNELIDKLNNLEDKIYQKENEYFEESVIGNIIKGFENFSKSSGSTTGGSIINSKRRVTYTDDDHIFSLSSVKYIKNYSRRHNYTNGSKDDNFENFEDSVEPPNNKSIDKISEISSNSSTPTRKRKARTLDD